MKRLLLVLPFLLAACDSSQSALGPADVATPAMASSANNTCTLVNGNVVARGYDQYGYNRCASMFNGTWAGYCLQRNEVPDCYGVLGTTKLNMNWNTGWDLGNFEGWSSAPYDAWLDNETRGAYTDGTPFNEHFKTKWDAGCVASGGTASSNGGTCIWGQFVVLMDQGKEDGAHTWWTKAVGPAGYGN